MAGERSGTVCVIVADGHGGNRPLTPFAGRSLVEWVVELCRHQGVDRFYVVAQGLERRSRIKSALGHGERFGVEVRYARPSFDRYEAGAAILRGLDHWDLTGDALVLSADSVFSLDLARMSREHRAAGATVTVAGVGRTIGETAGTYTAMPAGEGGAVRGFVPEPGREQLCGPFPHSRHDPAGTVPVNAGIYLVDCARLRAAAGDPDPTRRFHRRPDRGRRLLPWLVDHGEPVAAHMIDRLGYVGNAGGYLAALLDLLGGAYPQLLPMMGAPFGGERRWIHKSSLLARDDITGTTLAQKIRDGGVLIGPGVRIGSHVTVGPGVRLEHADVGDHSDLGEGTVISRSACGEGTVTGAYATVIDSCVGTYVGPGSHLARAGRSPESAPAGLAGVVRWADRAA
jgi:NDP-sugar pyrophosphorylase family protein